VIGHAEIAGGGIGGLTLGTMLARRGWTVRVHERADEIREIGAGIYIKNNSIEVLEEFGLFARLAPRGTQLARAQIRDRDGSVMITRPHDTHATRVHVFSRQALIESLRDGALEAGVEILTGSAVEGADADGTLLLANGKRLRADLVVGCDGFNSKVRAALGIRARSRLLDTCINRYLLPHREFTPEPVTTEHSSGQRRIGVTPCGDALTYVFTVCPQHETRTRTLPLDVPTWLETHPNIRPLLETLAGTPATSYQYGLVRCERWQRGRVALVGDAATGMPPTLGQGAGLTIMNGRALVEALDRAASVEAALPRWEEAVRPVSDLTQDWAQRWDWITRTAPPYLAWLRPLALGLIGAVPSINRRIRIADRGLAVIMSRL
jgi:2-polyprenyl-6-methoxyphenol hydroxylase-like FAD-dependent oxidoreductase